MMTKSEDGAITTQDKQHKQQQKHIIICAGLSCLDLQLVGCTKSGQEEAIEQYKEAIYCAGGSASMTATTLALIDTPTTTKNEQSHDDDNNTHRDIYIVTKLGNDRNSEILYDFYHNVNIQTKLCIQSNDVNTSMSVLPIFQSGGRGCYFNLAANESFTKDELLSSLETKLISSSSSSIVVVDAFLFGYPHLMPQLQGTNLQQLLQSIRRQTYGRRNNDDTNNDILIGIDLNGVSMDNHTSTTLGPALNEIDILHLNEEEIEIISKTSKHILLNESTTDDELLYAIQSLHNTTTGEEENNMGDGCAVVVLSMGSKGSFLSVTSNQKRLDKCPKSIRNHFKPGTYVRSPAFAIPNDNNQEEEGGDGKDKNHNPYLNANGAGDALFAGFCWAVATQNDLSLQQVGTFASLVARQRCDIRTRDTPTHNVYDLLTMVRTGTNLPPTIS